MLDTVWRRANWRERSFSAFLLGGDMSG